MSTQFIALEEVRIANPCRADWNKMQGDERTRFCGSCVKNVYNLSGMTRADAENLIREKEGKLCVRFYQRADGTIMTSDCNVGIAPPRKIKFSAAMMTMLLAPILAVGGAMATTTIDKAAAMNTLRDTPIIGAIINAVNPVPQPVMGSPVMGKMAMMGVVAFTPPTKTVPPTTGEIKAPICPTTSPTPNAKKSATEESAPEKAHQQGRYSMGAPLSPQSRTAE